MPVIFGRIKKIFVSKERLDRDIWILASSGMYLLKYENVAPEYEEVHNKFLKRLS